MTFSKNEINGPQFLLYEMMRRNCINLFLEDTLDDGDDTYNVCPLISVGSTWNCLKKGLDFFFYVWTASWLFLLYLLDAVFPPMTFIEKSSSAIRPTEDDVDDDAGNHWDCDKAHFHIVWNNCIMFEKL